MVTKPWLWAAGPLVKHNFGRWLPFPKEAKSPKREKALKLLRQCKTAQSPTVNVSMPVYCMWNPQRGEHTGRGGKANTRLTHCPSHAGRGWETGLGTGSSQGFARFLMITQTGVCHWSYSLDKGMSFWRVWRSSRKPWTERLLLSEKTVHKQWI